MTRKYFGTDGIRGTANRAPMTPDIALRVGLAAGDGVENAPPSLARGQRLAARHAGIGDDVDQVQRLHLTVGLDALALHV